MRKADKNEDNKMTLKELKHFLRQINIEVDDTYAEEIFKVGPQCIHVPVIKLKGNLSALCSP